MLVSDGKTCQLQGKEWTGKRERLDGPPPASFLAFHIAEWQDDTRTTSGSNQRVRAKGNSIVPLATNSRDAQVIGMQLLCSGTSVGANYRAVCRSRSKADFISKLGVVIEETDESAYWLELLIDTGVIKKEKLSGLLKEAQELTAIFNAARNTTRNK
jgi:four helix bundle protein